MSEQIEQSPSREWMKFGVLAIILVGVILVMALLRPYIFNQVVPAVMGEGQSTAPQPAQPDTTPPPEEEPAPIEDSPAEPVDAASPVVEEGEMSNEENGETAVSDPAAPLTHIVQPGETLYQIARTHNIDVDALISANNIANPNYITAGTPLMIPQP